MYQVYALKYGLGGPVPVLVDTGFRAEDAAPRGIAVGHPRFPSAEFWIQKAEIAFWTGPGIVQIA